ncbi:SGNH/GDSL hydrolase family protein [Bacillus pacificus]|uniref:SGNH/GDSL hydrolase family protein n=1 Tax=Bacillus pacificus TaxID=2026187 RepID=UPI001E60EF25|nr:SGNH/GDSL hydrolase family protein [Bacillus pacificus]MCC2472093.1 SGNH/GDSL hydrolase family protein [Bacillus pacificus]
MVLFDNSFGSNFKRQLESKFNENDNEISLSMNQYAQFVGRDYLNFDFTNNVINIPDGYVIKKDTFINISNKNESVPFVAEDGLQGLYFNLQTNRLFTAHYTQFPSIAKNKNILFVASFWGGSHKKVFAPFIVKVNGIINDSKIVVPTEYAQFVGNDLINFDFSDKKIFIPNGYVQTKKGFVPPSNDNGLSSKIGFKWEVKFPSTNLGIQCLFFDLKTGLFFTAHYSEFNAKITESTVLLYSFYDLIPNVFGGLVRVNGIIPTDVKFEKFDASKDRLILPQKIFLVKGSSLPIYKSSIVTRNEAIDTFKTAIQIRDTQPKVRYFYDLELNANEILGNPIRIYIKENGNKDEVYYKDIEVITVDAKDKAGASLTMILIGDSLTNRNIPQYLKEKLKEYGVNSVMDGTMINDGSVRGEGREGWEFGNFIGKNNVHSNGTVITRAESGSTTTNYQNPFLKLATPQDKSDYPYWCFRNTGSKIELSYAEDPNKSGDFYIFDFAWYLSAHDKATPEIVTIALGTNDLLQGGKEKGIQNARLGLEIMIKQIRKALPNCKIAVIPSPPYASNKNGNMRWEIATEWITQAQNDVKAMGISNVDIVPVWMHMNRDFNFPLADMGEMGNTGVKKASISDNVHFSDTGKREYVEALSAYVMNRI